MEQNTKNIAELSLTVKNKIRINKWLKLKVPYFFNTLCVFWPNSILFQRPENQFHNWILSIPLGNPGFDCKPETGDRSQSGVQQMTVKAKAFRCWRVIYR